MQLYGGSTYLCSQTAVIWAGENQEVLVMYVTKHLYCGITLRYFVLLDTNVHPLLYV